MKSPESDFKDQAQKINILPTTPDLLKVMVDSNSRLASRSKSSRGKLCIKEKCIEKFKDAEFEQKFTTFEENYRQNYDLGSPAGNHEVHNLSEWLKFMKEHYLEKIIKEDKIYKKMKLEELGDQLGVLKLVLRAGLQEFARQVSVQSIERGEVLSDLIKFYKLYRKSKAFHTEKNYQLVIKNLKESIKQLKFDLDKMKENLSGKCDSVRII